MLNKIKVLLGLANDTTKDNLLNVLIEQAIDEAMNYTHNEHIEELSSAICSMVVYNYNRIGTEGVNSESFSGVNYSYANDYPESIMRQLRAHRKVITV